MVVAKVMLRFKCSICVQTVLAVIAMSVETSTLVIKCIDWFLSPSVWVVKCFMDIVLSVTTFC